MTRTLSASSSPVSASTGAPFIPSRRRLCRIRSCFLQTRNLASILILKDAAPRLPGGGEVSSMARTIPSRGARPRGALPGPRRIPCRRLAAGLWPSIGSGRRARWSPGRCSSGVPMWPPRSPERELAGIVERVTRPLQVPGEGLHREGEPQDRLGELSGRGPFLAHQRDGGAASTLVSRAARSSWSAAAT